MSKHTPDLYLLFASSTVLYFVLLWVIGSLRVGTAPSAMAGRRDTHRCAEENRRRVCRAWRFGQALSALKTDNRRFILQSERKKREKKKKEQVPTD